MKLRKASGIILSLITLAILASCSVYKYSSIKPNAPKPSLKTYSIQKVEIFNAEVLLLDRTVLSNSLTQLIDMVMENNGSVKASPGDIQIGMRVFVEENDVINDRQTVSVAITFDNAEGRYASFMLSSKSKDILLDNSILIKELNDILADLKK